MPKVSSVWSMFFIGDCEPLFTLSGHTMPVNGLSCSRNDVAKNWLFSSSLDKTVKVWEVNHGQLVSTFVLDSTPSCILVDNILTSIFVGSAGGSIDCISLKPKKTYQSINLLTDEVSKFSGHKSEVTSLELSIDSAILFSGSVDQTVRVWLVKNLQCLRTLSFESVVTNLKVCLYQNCEHFEYPREKFPQLSRAVSQTSEIACLPMRSFDMVETELSCLDSSNQSEAPQIIQNESVNPESTDKDEDEAYELKRLKFEADGKFRLLCRKLAANL